jgi:para-aminobenzoate synthetase
MVYHDGKDIFHSIPSPFNAVRYHSLIVSHQDIPKDLLINAWCNEDKICESKDPLIMGFKHKLKPIWSVQFHPESICTEYGQIIVNNFCKLVEKHWSLVL